MKERLSPKDVYFRRLQIDQHREDDKIVVTKKNIEYIIFLHEQEKNNERTRP